MVKTKLHYKGFDLSVKSIPVEEYCFVNPSFKEVHLDEDDQVLNIMHITNHYVDCIDVSKGIIYKPYKDCKTKEYVSIEYRYFTKKYPTKKEIKNECDGLAIFKNKKEESDENL